MKKFTDLQKAQRYINDLGYFLKERHTLKQDRSFIYQHKYSKSKHLFLNSSYPFLSAGSMDMGTVWTIQTF